MHASTSWRGIIKLLKKLTETTNLDSGKALHGFLIKRSQLDVIPANYLINLYVKCGHMCAARELFDETPDRNVVSWNVLMAGYLHVGRPNEALSVLRAIDFGALSGNPNEYLFTTALASCAVIRSIDEGQQCHAYVLKSGLISHSYVKNSLLHMYTRCSDMNSAVELFESSTDISIFLFNSMINGFLENQQLTKAKNILCSMVKEIEQWDHVSYVAVLGLCADSEDLNFGVQIHGQILRRGMEFSVYVGSAIVDMYGKCRDVHSAWHTFHALPSHNVASWTSVMSVSVQNGFYEEALKFFLEMLAEGVRPNDLTYAVLLNSCAGLSALRTGDALNALAQKTGHEFYTNFGNALINMYAKSGNIEDATKIFKSMPIRDIISWNSIMIAYSHFGLSREALEIFRSMLMEEEVPTYVTFIAVLLACAHLGMIDEGFYYLNHSMMNLGIIPGVEHYTCMVSILCRAGLLDEAERFMRDTSTEWDIVAWRTLLSACQVYKNQGLGYKVAERILQLDPDDVGTYILLSNMYAKANRWDGVVRIRKIMRQKCMKKEPGISWIQIGRETHIFTSDDKKHPWTDQITEKVAEIMDQIKLIGYVPNFASVLHDVEDEQKENYLRYHSEKLAIAFALIKMPPEMPIRVMKNLRMCDDCHTAVKLISIVTRRKIFVRDANRFHCFEDGFCTCNDYW